MTRALATLLLAPLAVACFFGVLDVAGTVDRMPALVSATVETNEADDPELVAWSEEMRHLRTYVAKLPLRQECQ